MSAEPPRDVAGDVLTRLFGVALFLIVLALGLPLVIPILADRMFRRIAATKTQFWIARRWHWVANTVGVLLVVSLVLVEIMLTADWLGKGVVHPLLHEQAARAALMRSLLPWAVVNFCSGLLLLPVTWSIRRRRTAELVRHRRISDVVRQERIESARKRASDRTAAHRIGVKLDGRTGQILGLRRNATTVPLTLSSGLQAFGFVNQATVQSFAERLHDSRRVRDWIDPTGRRVVLPAASSAVRALIIAESGAGKTVLLNGLVLCALEYGWPVFIIDAKGDPADAEELVAVAQTYDRTVTSGETWNLFNGTAEQVTSKLMRLMPVPDGANQHYLDEIRGVLQAVQSETVIESTEDLRERLSHPHLFTRDQFDLGMVNQSVDRAGQTAAGRALHSLLIALRPMEEWIGPEGWSFAHPHSGVTIIPISPSDDAQAKLGDLLMLDLRHFLASRLAGKDKSPVVVIVDEFAQLVTGTQDPGDTAGSLFETARSAGVGLVLAAQSAAGISNDPARRERALTSGAALIFGRSKDPEAVVKYAGTAMRMESSASAFGEELGSGRAQHAFVIPPQDVREAADGAFWIVQSGAIASFRALPERRKPAAVEVNEVQAEEASEPDAA
jgi:hypothetical protein